MTFKIETTRAKHTGEEEKIGKRIMLFGGRNSPSKPESVEKGRETVEEYGEKLLFLGLVSFGTVCYC